MQNRHRILLVLAANAGIACVAIDASAQPSSDASDGPIAGTFTIDAGVETRQGVNRRREYALQEYTFLGGLQWRPAAEWRMRSMFRLVSETKLDKEPSDSFWLDEFFFQRQGNACTVSAGVQQVVWGSADRLRVLDQIHPLDLREYVFGDQVRTRLPLAMTNLDCSIGDHSLQWLIIPQTRHTERPTREGRFAVPDPAQALSAAGRVSGDKSTPDWRSPKDWSTGLKVASRVANADVALYALYQWQPDELAQPVETTTPQTYRLGRERFGMIGASVALPAGPFVVRTEWALTPNASAYHTSGPGVFELRRVRDRRALLAVDYSVNTWFFGLQLYDQNLTVGSSSVVPERQRVVTLAVRKEFLQGRATVGTYVARDFVRSGHYVTAEGSYQIDRQWQLRVGADYFEGDATSFGRFNAESRVYLSARYDYR